MNRNVGMHHGASANTISANLNGASALNIMHPQDIYQQPNPNVGMRHGASANTIFANLNGAYATLNFTKI